MKFKDAFWVGISEADQAAKDAKEIESVLVDLQGQILDVSGQNISIVLSEASEYTDSNPEGEREYISLMASNDIMIEELAEWKTGVSGGYPCELTFNGITTVAQDKHQLENALVELISLPQTGKIFKDLLEKNAVISSDPEFFH